MSINDELKKMVSEIENQTESDKPPTNRAKAKAEGRLGRPIEPLPDVGGDLYFDFGEPTREEIQELYRRGDGKLVSDLRTDHITDESERGRLQHAINHAKSYRHALQERRGLNLVMVAYPSKRRDKSEQELYMGAGCGKTHIAEAMMNALASHVWLGSVDSSKVVGTGKFFSESKLISNLMAGKYDLDQIIPPATRIIAIDELGLTKTLPYVKPDHFADVREQRYQEIINHCYRHKVGIVITSNKTSDEIKDIIGSYAYSRLRERLFKRQFLDMTGIQDYRNQPYTG